MTDTNKFVGLTEAKARALAAEAGPVVAVNKGVSSLLTNSMEMNRVTFSVSDGKVVAARVG